MTEQVSSVPFWAESLTSERELVKAAWAIASRGHLKTVNDAEAALVGGVTDIQPPRPAFISDLRTAIAEGGDPLGDAFLAIRSPDERRSLGATYTPSDIIESMTAWISDNSSPSRIIDPGAGSGRFALAAGKAFPKASLIAVEVDPVAALMLRANLTASGLDKQSTVLLRDFRNGDFGPSDGQTAYIGNPPYVRHHQIDREWKEWLTLTANGFGLSASQLAGLHVHFFLAALANAKQGDVGSFITSAEWLDVNYGRLVRQLLLGELGGLSIHVIDPRVMPFEGTATTGAITCFSVGSDAPSIKMKRVDSVNDLARLDKGRRFAKKRLNEAKRWTALLRATPQLPQGYIELGELCRVHRGAVTGSNATWITQADDPALPSDVLFPSVTKARELFSAGPALASDDGLRVVIDLPEDLDVLDKADRVLVERFLRRAKRDGVHSGYIAKNRKAWWSVGLRDPAPILATYMARQPPAFVRNLAEARHINIAHGLYPCEGLPKKAVDRLAQSLRETVSTTQGRTYAGGLTKFEPREMERLPVPDLSHLLAAQ